MRGIAWIHGVSTAFRGIPWNGSGTRPGMRSAVYVHSERPDVDHNERRNESRPLALSCAGLQDAGNWSCWGDSRGRPMTEAEWLACEDPMAMLIFLKDYSSGFVDYQDIDRKLRLFSCACCRSRRECREDSLLLATIGTAERYADGETTKQELQTARRALKAEREVVGNMFSASELYSAFDTVSWLWGTGSIPARLKDQQVGLRLCTFGRCIFGNLFRPVAVDQSWLTPPTKVCFRGNEPPKPRRF